MLTSYKKPIYRENDNASRSSEGFFTNEETLKDTTQGRGKDLFKTDMDPTESGLDSIIDKLMSLSNWSRKFFDEHTQTLSMYTSFFTTNFNLGVSDMAKNAVSYLDKLLENPEDRTYHSVKIPTDAFVNSIKDTAIIGEEYVSAIYDLVKFVEKLCDLFDEFGDKSEDECLLDVVKEILGDSTDMTKSRYDLLHDTFVSKKDEEGNDVSLLSKLETVADLADVLHLCIDKRYSDKTSVSSSKNYPIMDPTNSDDKYSNLRDSLHVFSDDVSANHLIACLNELCTKILHQCGKFDEIKTTLLPLNTIKVDKLEQHQIELFKSYSKVIVSYCSLYEKVVSFTFGLFELLSMYIAYLKTNFGKPAPLAGI